MQAHHLFELQTPALVLDRTRLQSNAWRIQAKIAALGVTLRPHVKTSKSIEVLRMLDPGASPLITVSTLAEARYFFGHGIRDILYAVGLAPVKLPEVADLIRSGCELKVIVDTIEATDAIAEFSAREAMEIDVLIEIDCDGYRGGVSPADPVLTKIGARLGRSLAGVMTHAGASYSCRTPSQFEHMAEQERRLAVDAALRLRAAGLSCEIVSVGSTPTLHYARGLEGVTEVRAGVYAFGDLVQAELGTCTLEDIAVGVLASVIGYKRDAGRVLIDAGFLALSRDRGTADFAIDWGYGAVADPVTGIVMDDLLVSSTNQEHGIITARAGLLDVERFPVGSRVKVLPNHACATAAAYDRYHVTEGGTQIVGVWERVNGW